MQKTHKKEISTSVWSVYHPKYTTENNLFEIILVEFRLRRGVGGDGEKA